MVTKGTGQRRGRIVVPASADEPTLEAMEHRLKAGARVWHERVHRIVEDSRQSTAEVARHYGVAQRTLQNWLKTTGVPSLSHMLLLHTHKVYPLAEQIIDLCGLQVGDLEPTQAVWEPQPSLMEIKEAVDRALGRSVATVPSLQDVVARIDESCWASDDYGRWRSRFFDIPMGWHFPHLGYRGVEFLPWYGPEREDDPEPAKREAYLELDELGYDQWFRDEITGPFFEEGVPPAFDPVRTPLTSKQAWDQCRHERMELVKRMGPLHAASQGIWYGAYGTIHAPLLWRGGAGNVVGRHIFVQPVLSPQPPPTGIPVLAVGETPVHTVLVLGTSPLSVPRIGQLVADALGWLGLDYRLFAQRLLGRRVSLGLIDQLDREPRALTYLLRPRTMPIVLYANVNYFTLPEDGQHQPRPEALALLRQDGVLPVLLTHNDLDTKDTSHWWHVRQQTASWNRQEVAPFSDERITRELTERWIDVFNDQVPSGVIAELQPSIPWAGPGTVRPDNDIAAWFTHPTVGDIQVRAAYEIASWLRGSAVAETKPNLRRVDFARDSVVDRYATQLRACTGGDFLTGGPTEFEERYLRAPDDPPTRGRFISWIKTPRRAPTTRGRRTPPVMRRA